jgi:hypothetical protein
MTHTLLVSPLGMSKGLLYSALVQIPCDSCLVIASDQSILSLPEIQKQAHYHGKIETKLLNDVFLGFSETTALVQACNQLLLASDTIICNITGGTTAQQFVIQALYESAKKHQKKVKRVALIDRRDALEQRNNPYVSGELVELD